RRLGALRALEPAHRDLGVGGREGEQELVGPRELAAEQGEGLGPLRALAPAPEPARRLEQPGLVARLARLPAQPARREQLLQGAVPEAPGGALAVGLAEDAGPVGELAEEDLGAGRPARHALEPLPQGEVVAE